MHALSVEQGNPIGNVMNEEGAGSRVFFARGWGRERCPSAKIPRPVFKLLTGGQKMNIKSLLLGSAAATTEGFDGGHDAFFDGGNVEHIYVELGGFRIGKTDSLFVTETGYASDVVNDGLIKYGPFDTHQIAYTYDFGNGFSISGAVE